MGPIHITQFQGILFKQWNKTLTILSVGLPACWTASLPAVRPGSTSAMAPDFSHKKGNHV